jgi:hypothetical protein
MSGSDIYKNKDRFYVLQPAFISVCNDMFHILYTCETH